MIEATSTGEPYSQCVQSAEPRLAEHAGGTATPILPWATPAHEPGERPNPTVPAEDHYVDFVGAERGAPEGTDCVDPAVLPAEVRNALEEHLFGLCFPMALALHRRTGYPLSVLLDVCDGRCEVEWEGRGRRGGLLRWRMRIFPACHRPLAGRALHGCRGNPQ